MTFLTDFEIEPISADVASAVAVVLVAVDVVANVEPVRAGVHVDCRETASILRCIVSFVVVRTIFLHQGLALLSAKLFRNIFC